MNKILIISVIVALVALAVVFGPLAIIWALNTLFPVLAIPYNFWTWAAVVIFNIRYVSLSKIAFTKE